MNIELLRMVCAIGVVLAHLCVFPVNKITNEYLSIGAIGVDFFFLISGYSMMAMLKKYQIENKKKSIYFIFNRFIRVAIPYYVATFIMVLVFIFYHKPIFLTSILNSLFFLKNLNQELGRSYIPLLPPGWTINYEVLFYVSLSLSLFLVHKMRYSIAIFVLGMLTTAFIPVSYLWIEFFIGCGIFYYRQPIKKIVDQIGLVGIAATMVFCILIIVKNKHLAGEEVYFYQRFVFWGLPATPIFIFIALGKLVGSIPTPNFSYSIYLVHWPVMYLLNQQKLEWNIFFVCSAVLFFSYMFYHIVELPCLKLSRKLL